MSNRKSGRRRNVQGSIRSTGKNNIKGKACYQIEAVTDKKISAIKENPTLYWNKRRVSSGQDSTYLSFQFVEDRLRHFLFLESRQIKALLLLKFKRGRVHPKLADELGRIGHFILEAWKKKDLRDSFGAVSERHRDQAICAIRVPT